MFDLDRPIRGASRIAVVRQAVAENHDLIESQHGLGGGRHEGGCHQSDEETEEAKH
jgi:hypothetical protein